MKARNDIQTSLQHKITQEEDTRKINSLFGFNQQNAGRKWLLFCLFIARSSVESQILAFTNTPSVRVR